MSGKFQRCAALALAGALLAGSGCARLRRCPAVPAKHADEAQAGEESGSLPGGKRKKFAPVPEKVLALQMQALSDQRTEYADEKAHCGNRFTGWLDRTHEGLYVRMDNAVRRLDTLGLPAGSDYNYKVSTFRLSSYVRAGGRGNEKDFDAKVKFKARLALPRIERELYLFIDNAGRDSLPGSDPMESEDDTRVGLRSVKQFIKESEIEASGGLRLRGSGPVAYGELSWRWNRGCLGGELEFVPSGFYYSDDGLGQMTTLEWTRPCGTRRALQLMAAERSTEATEGLEFEYTVRHAWYRSGRKRGWVARASAFPHLKSSTWYWDNATLSLTWRDALYKKWVYVTLTPQLDFAKEDDYDPKPSFRVGLEILFGGKPGDIL